MCSIRLIMWYLQGKPLSQARINCWKNQKKIIDKLFGSNTDSQASSQIATDKDKKQSEATSSDEGPQAKRVKLSTQTTSCYSKLVTDPPPLRLYYNKVLCRICTYLLESIDLFFEQFEKTN